MLLKDFTMRVAVTEDEVACPNDSEIAA